MNAEDYLDNVLKVIAESFRATDPTGSMPVATIAYLVKQRLNIDYAILGFAKFKDVLTELEKRGEIRTGQNSRGAYSLWVGGTPIPIANNPSGLSLKSFRPLRNPVWLAFVAEAPQGRRFLNRITGDVRLGLQAAPDRDWIEIEPIDSATQKLQANQFLTDNGLDSVQELRDSLASQRWFFEFPRALAALNPQRASDWKRRRSEWVIGEVEKWCAKSDVKTELVFEHQQPRGISIGRQRQRDDLRFLLLSAIEHMSTDRLLDLPISPRLIIAAVRPDLLDT